MKPPAVVHDQRPWGWFTQYTENEEVTVKIITVLPGQQLSYQKHHHRDEAWVPLDEGLRVSLNERSWVPVRYLEETPILIPRGTIHSVKNPTEKPCRFLEICFGVFDEDDIERLDDLYGRVRRVQSAKKS